MHSADRSPCLPLISCSVAFRLQLPYTWRQSKQMPACWWMRSHFCLFGFIGPATLCMKSQPKISLCLVSRLSLCLWSDQFSRDVTVNPTVWCRGVVHSQMICCASGLTVVRSGPEGGYFDQTYNVRKTLCVIIGIDNGLLFCVVESKNLDRGRLRKQPKT